MGEVLCREKQKGADTGNLRGQSGITKGASPWKSRATTHKVRWLGHGQKCLQVTSNWEM